MPAGKPEIRSWAMAEEYAASYVRLISEAEQIEEAFHEFAAGRKTEIGREREIPLPLEAPPSGIIIGFEKIPAEARVPAAALHWLEAQGTGIFTRQKTEAKKTELRNYLEAASEAIVSRFGAQGIVIVKAYDRFYLKLARARAGTECRQGDNR